MEKIQEKKKPQEQKLNLKNLQANNKKADLVWDCGSTLYDSFELKSFERQLHSAINSRSLSMPHIPDCRVLAPPPPPPVPKKPSKISRSLNKFLKSVFKSKQNSAGAMFRVKDRLHDEYYVIYDKSGALTTIPEVPEIDLGGFSPEINSLVRRTASDRFSAASIGISCA